MNSNTDKEKCQKTSEDSDNIIADEMDTLEVDPTRTHAINQDDWNGPPSMPIGLVLGVKDTRPKDILDAHAVEEIRSGKYKDQINSIRDAQRQSDESTANRLKLELPAYLWSGTFVERNKAGLKQHSGLICMDLDKGVSDRLAEVKATIFNEPECVACFISPRGKGIKAVFRMAPDAENHEKYFDVIAERIELVTGAKVDQSGKDVSRLCFTSYDPDILYKQTKNEIHYERENNNAAKISTYKKISELYTVPNDCVAELCVAESMSDCVAESLSHCVAESLSHCVNKSLSNCVMCIEEELAVSYIPKAKSVNHNLLYRMSRKALRMLAFGQTLNTDVVFDYWWKYSQEFVDQEQGREAYYFEWTKALDNTLSGVLWDSWIKSNNITPPPEAERVEHLKIKRLICWCSELSAKSDNGTFFLGCRMIQEFFKHPSHITGYNWLGLLVKLEILEIITLGSNKTWKATLYRYKRIAPTEALSP